MAHRPEDRTGSGDLTVDPDARHAHKTGVLAEGADRDIGGDQFGADGGVGVLRPDEPIEVLGDSAYATGDMLHTLKGKKWTPLLKP